MVSGVSIAMSNLGKAWGYTKRVGEVVPELIFGSASESIGETLRKTNGSLFTKAQAGWHALEKAGAGNFFQNFVKNFKNFIPCIKSNILTKTSAARLTGKNVFLEGTKGFFKGIGKKMPFIGALSMMLFELPNIFTATKEKGIFQGGAEVIKSTAKLTGGGLGAAIGSAIIPIPFVGTMAGWIAGEWFASKIVGKSYSEEKAEKEEQLKAFIEQQQQMQTPEQAQEQPQQNGNPFWMQNPQAEQIAQTPAANPQMQMTNSPTMQGNVPTPQTPAMPAVNTPGAYNPFAVQNQPYSDDIMKPNFQYNMTA